MKETITTPFADSIKKLPKLEQKVEMAKKYYELKMPINLKDGHIITNIEYDSFGKVYITCNDKVYDFKELDLTVSESTYDEPKIDEDGLETKEELTRNTYEDIFKKLQLIFK